MPELPGRTADPERFALLIDSVEDYAIFMLDTEGCIASWNRGAQAIKGYEAHEVIGRPFEMFYTDEAVRTGWPREELRRARDEGRVEDAGWRVRKDGTRFWAHVTITALRDATGELLGYGKVTRDMTEARAQQQSLRQSEEQLRLLVESVGDCAIYLLDPQGHVLTWNAGAQRIHGYTAAQAIGQHFGLFFEERDRRAGKPGGELTHALREGHLQVQGWRQRQDGSSFWAEASLTPVRDAGGELRGFAKVTRDMSKHRRLAELEHSSQRISAFLAMLAHELRNPLAPIRNAVGILQLQAGLSPALVRVRDIIDRQVHQMTRLVDDLLDAGRIATGKIALERTRIDFRLVVQVSLETVRPVLDQRQHRLHLQLEDAPLWLAGDLTRLAQALQNLLHNAARYTPEGGDITLSVRRFDTQLVARITDTGIGIAPEALDRIFELFAQEDGPGRRPNESGLGIGLSLARTLVEQHGGTLRADSGGPGCGATFEMRLPALPAESDSNVTPETRTEPTLPDTARRVLVVDDNIDSADSIVELLRLMQHDASAVYTGAAVPTAVADFAPQLVLLDLNLPDGNGFDVLARLLQQWPRLRVAAMTGYGQPSDRQRTAEAGFIAHLTKPVDLDELQALIDAPLDVIPPS